jgi:cyclopropane-fatty-acyl-phospholipid synthase
MIDTLLNRLQHGRLQLTFADGRTQTYGQGDVLTDLSVKQPDVFKKILKGGDVAFGETYFEGDWETTDLTALLTLLAKNQSNLMPAFYGKGFVQWFLKLRHALRKNSKAQAKKNIVAHYDLGNNFYQLWLDPSMTYSSAYFGQGASDLQAAQQAKYARVCQQIGAKPGMHLLEIGCGWGGFAEYAAKHHGCRITGLTLSPAQLAFAKDRIIVAGLSDQVLLKLQDYRDEKNHYDAVVSIEMFEAVGMRYWKSYFATVARSLKPGGVACIQAITIDETREKQYQSGTDFIQQYIFPGGMLASPTRFRQDAQIAGLSTTDSHAFGLDYARTLSTWLAQFDAAKPQVLAMGFSESFIRCWRFYLAYCIAGFVAESTSVYQFTLKKASL